MAQKGVYGRQCLATGERGANQAPFTEARMAGYGASRPLPCIPAKVA
jgi:hypothetical protein